MTRHHLLSSITVALLVLPLSIHAQDTTAMRTLLGSNKPIAHGGWGAPTAHYTRIMDQDALLVGGRGGWIIDHRFTLGLAGHGLVTNVGNAAYDDLLIANGRRLSGASRFVMGYGGLLLEPVIAYRSPVHISLPLIIGAGGCGYQVLGTLPADFDPFTHEDDTEAFFVVEPGVALELNVLPLVRVGLEASYRYTSDLDLRGTAADALIGFNAGISIKVGVF